MSETHSAEKDVTYINGHRIKFWARWWRCTRCEASLLTLMQFQARECPGGFDA